MSFRKITSSDIYALLGVILLNIIPGVYCLINGYLGDSYEQFSFGFMLSTAGLAVLFVLLVKGRGWLSQKLDPYF